MSSTTAAEEKKETIMTTDEKHHEEESTKKALSKLKVTVLSGFLGAGKTTLLKRILHCNNTSSSDEQMKIAVIVNDMGEINLDAEEIKSSKVIQEDAEMVEMHNGCICCTLRGDLLKTVKELSTTGDFEYLVIESTGISEPLPVAQTFVMDVDNMEEGHNHDHDHPPSARKPQAKKTKKSKKEPQQLQIASDERKSLSHFATLDTLVTVVDALNIYKVLSSVQTLADKDNLSGMEGNAPPSSASMAEKDPAFVEQQRASVIAAVSTMPLEMLRHTLQGHGILEDVSDIEDRTELTEKLLTVFEKTVNQVAEPQVDDRSISKLLLDQIEFANVIVLSKVPLFLEEHTEQELEEMKKMLSKLNPGAKLVVPREAKFGDLNVSAELLNTQLFDMAKAQQSTSWVKEILAAENHTPETEEYGISSMTYINRDMPFHPERLHKALKSLKEENGQGEMSSWWLNTTKEEKSDSNSSLSSGVVRIKGRIWLANCMVFGMDFQCAGRHIEMNPTTVPFTVERPRRAWSDQDKKTVKWMKKKGWWTEKWGDRQTQLVIIGCDLDKGKINSFFDQALLTEEEGEQMGGPDEWGTKLKDPFYHGQLQRMCKAFYASIGGPSG